MYYTIFVKIIAEHNAVCQVQYEGPDFFGHNLRRVMKHKGLETALLTPELEI